MKYVDVTRITRDIYLTDLAVVISTNFYFTIRYKRILLFLYVRFSKFKKKGKDSFLSSMLCSIYNSKESRDPRSSSYYDLPFS